MDYLFTIYWPTYSKYLQKPLLPNLALHLMVLESLHQRLWSLLPWNPLFLLLKSLLLVFSINHLLLILFLVPYFRFQLLILLISFLPIPNVLCSHFLPKWLDFYSFRKLLDQKNLLLPLQCYLKDLLCLLRSLLCLQILLFIVMQLLAQRKSLLFLSPCLILINLNFQVCLKIEQFLANFK